MHFAALWLLSCAAAAVAGMQGLEDVEQFWRGEGEGEGGYEDIDAPTFTEAVGSIAEAAPESAEATGHGIAGCSFLTTAEACAGYVRCSWYGDLPGSKCRKVCGLQTPYLCETLDRRCVWIPGSRCVLKSSGGGGGTPAPISSPFIRTSRPTILQGSNAPTQKTSAPSNMPTIYPTNQIIQRGDDNYQISGPFYVSVLIPPISQSNSNQNDGDQTINLLIKQVSTRLQIDMGNIEVELCNTMNLMLRNDHINVNGFTVQNNQRDCLLYSKIGNFDKNNDDHINYRMNMLWTIKNYDASVFSLQDVMKYMYQGIFQVLNLMGGSIFEIQPSANDLMLSRNQQEQQKPNIIFLLADDLGYGDIGIQTCKNATAMYPCTSDQLTPTIDTIARDKHSIVFKRFYAMNQCGPSRVSFLTGRQPERDCLDQNLYSPDTSQKALPKTLVTIAEVAKKGGYKTSFFGKWHVTTLMQMHSSTKGGATNPKDHGFDYWLATKASATNIQLNCGCYRKCTQDLGLYSTAYGLSEYNQKLVNKYIDGKSQHFYCNQYYNMFTNDTQLKIWPEAIDGEDSNFLVDEFEKYLAQEDLSDPSPLMSFIWFHDVHAPFVALPSNRAKAKALVDLENPVFCGQFFDIPSKLQAGRLICKDKYGEAYCDNMCRFYKQEYYGSIMALDAAVLRIKTIMETNPKFKDNTILIFASDNGPARFDATGDGSRFIGPGSTGGLPGVKLTYTEGGLRVPCIINAPSYIKQNTILRYSPVGSIDLYATVLALANLDIATLNGIFQASNGLDGASLIPYFFGLTQIERYKPLGFKIQGNQDGSLLMFHNYTLRYSYSSDMVDFLDVKRGGISPKVNTAVATKNINSNGKYTKSFKRWYNGIYACQN